MPLDNADQSTPESTSMKDAILNSLTCPWMKRVGLAGFMFFFVKGLVWLVVLYWVGRTVT